MSHIIWSVQRRFPWNKTEIELQKNLNRLDKEVCWKSSFNWDCGHRTSGRLPIRLLFRYIIWVISFFLSGYEEASLPLFDIVVLTASCQIFFRPLDYLLSFDLGYLCSYPPVNMQFEIGYSIETILFYTLLRFWKYSSSVVHIWYFLQQYDTFFTTLTLHNVLAWGGESKIDLTLLYYNFQHDNVSWAFLSCDIDV